jgi:FKBP-type peptidyl-prolyl cis-trans isomerase
MLREISAMVRSLHAEQMSAKENKNEQNEASVAEEIQTTVMVQEASSKCCRLSQGTMQVQATVKGDGSGVSDGSADSRF